MYFLSYSTLIKFLILFIYLITFSYYTSKSPYELKTKKKNNFVQLASFKSLWRRSDS